MVSGWFFKDLIEQNLGVANNLTNLIMVIDIDQQSLILEEKEERLKYHIEDDSARPLVLHISKEINVYFVLRKTNLYLL